ncbi:MAG: amino acid permease [Acidobacteria bacterium]|nr:amino acid permease [Acidobacteriota bacterium]
MSSSPCQPREASQNPPELQRRLRERHLVMIAIGDAIGVGLFLGSSVTLNLAGPGVILAYALCAVVGLILASAVAEMSVVHPVAGSLGLFAERYINPWAGFTVRVTYGLLQIVAVGAEITAAAIYFQYWFPQTPQWLWVAALSLGIMAVNAAPIKGFGEVEYWFSLLKTAAIVIFIAVGIALITGLSPRPAIGYANLTAHGGFLPHGWSGVWLSLTLVLASYLGIEAIAISAGEAERPETTIPRAMRRLILLLTLLYLSAICIMATIFPWNQAGDGTVAGSPFVRAFTAVRVPYAASVMNLVVIVAAVSGANTLLYLSTRMLFSLARGDYAPAALGKLSARGVPYRALLVASAGMFIAILLSAWVPQEVFLFMYGAAVTGMYLIWAVVLAAHLRFRRSAGSRSASVKMRLRLFPASNLFAIAILLGVVASTFYVRGLRYSLPIVLAVVIMVSLSYAAIGRKHGVK